MPENIGDRNSISDPVAQAMIIAARGELGDAKLIDQYLREAGLYDAGGISTYEDGKIETVWGVFNDNNGKRVDACICNAEGCCGNPAEVERYMNLARSFALTDAHNRQINNAENRFNR